MKTLTRIIQWPLFLVAFVLMSSMNSYAQEGQGYATYRVGTHRDGYEVKLLGMEQSSAQGEVSPLASQPLVIHFPFDTARLGTSQKQLLKQAFAGKTMAKTHQINVVGYTDSIGTTAYNQHLGQLRALAVKTYLVLLGVEPKQVHIFSKGESSPASSNQTIKGRQLNRRAVIISSH